VRLDRSGQTDDYILEFDDHTIGYLEIELMMEGDGTNLQANQDVPLLFSIVQGNIEFVKDMYAAGGEGSHAQSELADCCWMAKGSDRVFAKIHIHVSSATAGIRNRLQINRALNPELTGPITQWQMTIREYNHGFSYKENGIGENEAPMLADLTGRLIVPGV